MLHQIYYHIVWTTRDRRPTITARVATFLDRLLRSIALQERVMILELGIVSTHVHLLVRAHPMTVIPRLLQRLKGASSALAGKELRLDQAVQLRWAQGYTIQSLSGSQVDMVRDYVRRQPEKHPQEAIRDWSPPQDMPAGPGADPLSDDPVACLERRYRV